MLLPIPRAGSSTPPSGRQLDAGQHWEWLTPRTVHPGPWLQLAAWATAKRRLSRLSIPRGVGRLEPRGRRSGSSRSTLRRGSDGPRQVLQSHRVVQHQRPPDLLRKAGQPTRVGLWGIARRADDGPSPANRARHHPAGAPVQSVSTSSNDWSRRMARTRAAAVTRAASIRPSSPPRLALKSPSLAVEMRSATPRQYWRMLR